MTTDEEFLRANEAYAATFLKGTCRCLPLGG